MKTSSFRFIPSLLVGGALCLSLGACDTDEPETIERSAEVEPLPEVTTDPATAPVELSLEEQIATLQPRKTRAGFLRFTDPAVEKPEAAPLLLARLDAGEDSPAVRSAIAEAIGRTHADYAAEVSARIPNEADARVREVLVGTLGRRAPGTDAHAGLLAGLQDSEAVVRSAAARALAHRSDGAELAAGLITLLADDDAKVRADAARSLGVLGVADAVTALDANLDDADADVRLNALRALHRIDPAHAAGLDLARFSTDEDSRVSRLAVRIAQGE